MVAIMSLYSDIQTLCKTEVSKTVKRRLKEFRALGRRGNKDWFSELCFCILTANSKAHTALAIQHKLGCVGFMGLNKKQLTKVIRENKHRFHNTKARFIVNARKFRDIKDILAKEKDPRRWLAYNVKGIGWKESSHFLRNVGYTGYAILDRHILTLMLENGLIRKKPKALNEKNYLAIEKKLGKFAKKLKMSHAELDLYMWFLKTNKVLK
jgi:N-glycosylase/DNA lyase